MTKINFAFLEEELSINNEISDRIIFKIGVKKRKSLKFVITFALFFKDKINIMVANL